MTGWREKCDEVTSAGCGAVGYIAALEAAAVAYSPWPSLTDVLAGAGLSHLADGRKAAILAANNADRLATFTFMLHDFARDLANGASADYDARGFREEVARLWEESAK